mgnify:CR=1 FL=1
MRFPLRLGMNLGMYLKSKSEVWWNSESGFQLPACHDLTDSYSLYSHRHLLNSCVLFHQYTYGCSLFWTLSSPAINELFHSLLPLKGQWSNWTIVCTGNNLHWERWELFHKQHRSCPWMVFVSLSASLLLNEWGLNCCCIAVFRGKKMFIFNKGNLKARLLPIWFTVVFWHALCFLPADTMTWPKH